MFADSDFIFALIKESDWLKNNAGKIFEKYKGNIKISISVIIELALVCKKFNMECVEMFSNLFQLFETDEGTREITMRAAIYIDKHKLNVFDAFHASFAFKDKIISSDSIYEIVGLERVKLE